MVIINLQYNVTAATIAIQDKRLTMDAGAYSIIYLLKYIQFFPTFSHRPHSLGFHSDTKHICYVLLLYTTDMLLIFIPQEGAVV